MNKLPYYISAGTLVVSYGYFLFQVFEQRHSDLGGFITTQHIRNEAGLDLHLDLSK